MATKDAYSAVKSLLTLLGPNGPLTHSLSMLRDNLAEAMSADNIVAQLRAQVSPLEVQLADLKAQTTFAVKEYEVKTASARSAYDAFNTQVQKQSADKQAYIDALTKQAEGLEASVENGKRLLAQRMNETQTSVAQRQRQLERDFQARLLQLQLEEKDAQDRVNVAKEKLNALIQSLGAS